MDKYIGMEIDCMKVVACVVQQRQQDRYTTLPADVEAMRVFLQEQRLRYFGLRRARGWHIRWGLGRMQGA